MENHEGKGKKRKGKALLSFQGPCTCVPLNVELDVPALPFSDPEAS